MGLDTVSTAQAAELMDVSAETIRDRIADNLLPGVTMEGGAWRIPVSSLRVLHPASSGASQLDAEPPPFIQRLIERLEAFDTGTIPPRCGTT
jgi:excisionase family DNA binding protein